jgi:hypothetical protein
MSIKAIFKHFQKDSTFETEHEEGVLSVSLRNPEGELCNFFLFESKDPILGKKVVILAPVIQGVSQVDFNALFSPGGAIAENVASWQRFGLKVSDDDLFLRKFLSSEQDPMLVRRQAVMMAWSATALGNLILN